MEVCAHTHSTRVGQAPGTAASPLSRLSLSPWGALCPAAFPASLLAAPSRGANGQAVGLPLGRGGRGLFLSFFSFF